jgi:hypothetical protein
MIDQDSFFLLDRLSFVSVFSYLGVLSFDSNPHRVVKWTRIQFQPSVLCSSIFKLPNLKIYFEPLYIVTLELF